MISTKIYLNRGFWGGNIVSVSKKKEWKALVLTRPRTVMPHDLAVGVLRNTTTERGTEIRLVMMDDQGNVPAPLLSRSKYLCYSLFL